MTTPISDMENAHMRIIIYKKHHYFGAYREGSERGEEIFTGITPVTALSRLLAYEAGADWMELQRERDEEFSEAAVNAYNRESQS
jgi:hypothetical protein